TPPPPPPSSRPFPRRALIVSVHNYLYANPIMPGAEGSAAFPGATKPAVSGLIPALNRGLEIPMTQIFHVSDVAKKNPLPPLKPPPEGVEVWSACSAAQQSHEFDGAALGVFLDSLRLALVPVGKGERGALEGKIPKHDDLIPLETLHAAVAARMTARLEKRK